MKYSIYDRNNYINKNNKIVGSFIPIGKPLVGGTVIPLDTDGKNFKALYILLQIRMRRLFFLE